MFIEAIIGCWTVACVVERTRFSTRIKLVLCTKKFGKLKLLEAWRPGGEFSK